MNGATARSAAEHPGGGLEPTTPTRPSRLDGHRPAQPQLPLGLGLGLGLGMSTWHRAPIAGG